MSYSDSQPPFESQSSYQSFSPRGQSQLPYQSDGIVIPVLPQFPEGGNDQFNPHSRFDRSSFKRHRVSDDDDENQFCVNPSNSLPVNKGTTNIFFKTKMCAKFKAGTCRNGENCNFAHGEQDKRQPPPNWQELVGVGTRGSEEDRPVGNWDDDQRIIHRMKLCKKFYNGEVCPYGDRCNFLHEEPSKFRDESGRYRESSAISIGTAGQPVGQGSVGVNMDEVNRSVNNNAVSINSKPVYWKTKLCTKMETTGICPFGEKCHFAHGLAELQLYPGGLEVEIGNGSAILTKPQQSFLTNDASPTNISRVPSFVEEGQTNKVLLKWKGPKKINKIYGDWLDDLPLVTNFNNGVES